MDLYIIQDQLILSVFVRRGEMGKFLDNGESDFLPFIELLTE